MAANLPYGSPVITDIDSYRTIFSDIFLVSVAMLVVGQFLGEEKPVFSL